MDSIWLMVECPSEFQDMLQVLTIEADKALHLGYPLSSLVLKAQRPRGGFGQN